MQIYVKSLSGMMSKNTIKFIKSLQIKKNRQELGLFVAEGPKLINELIEHNFQVHSIYCAQSNCNKILRIENYDYNSIEESEIKKISSLSTPPGSLGIFKIPAIDFDLEIIRKDFFLMFENIRDPGNLGTIIRLADWFGLKNIICSDNSVDNFNSKVVQSTMGSIARVKVYYKNFFELLPLLKNSGVPLLGVTMQGQSVYNFKFDQKSALIFGNESLGISDQIESLVDNKITIPPFSSEEKPESLNLAVAAAIVCSEVRRKK